MNFEQNQISYLGLISKEVIFSMYCCRTLRKPLR